MRPTNAAQLITRPFSIMLIGVFILATAIVAVPFYTAQSKSNLTVDFSKAAFHTGSLAKAHNASVGIEALKDPTFLMSTLRTPLMLAPQDPGESIATFEVVNNACTATPKSSFNLGETVCAVVTGAPLGDAGRAARRIAWVSPYDSLAQGADITTDPQNGLYAIPSSATQTFTDAGGGMVTVDNRGTWSVGIYSASDGSFRTAAKFVVHDPQTPFVDLYVSQAKGTDQVTPGSSGVFHIFVTNFGPDTAQNVVLTDDVPANTTLVGPIVQTSGPSFSCTGPAAGGTGTITCTIASLASSDSATFDLAYNVNATTPTGTIISNTATISSDTGELRPDDNSATATTTVAGASTGGGTGTCSVGCPDDIRVGANTTQNNQDGAIVHFSPPSGNTECGAIIVDHCNDCFFPVGITTVTATAATTDSCSFTVTVNPPNSGGPSIVCPSNKTADADNNCQATVNVGAPVASGNNVTIVGVRSDGKPMYNCDCFPNSPDQQDDSCNIFGGCSRKVPDAPFAAGVTTITWTAITHDTPGPYTTPADEEAHRTGNASCTQTITVNDVTPPVITATDSTVSADANCQAAVPDYSNQVTDNCACAANDNSQDCVDQHRITTTQTPAAGTMVGLGPHIIHITANDGSSNNGGAGNTSQKDVTFTVNDTTPPTINCPANITTNTDPGICAAAVVTGTATATDNCDPAPTITATRSDNQPLIALYPKGTTTITWTATDASGNHSSCTQTVTVVDHEPPVITFNGNTPSMSPPNHSYHTFTPADFISSVSDNCDSLSISDVYIIKATSDEPNHSAGSGNTTPDIVIATDCKSVQLRAERVGGGNGRVYTIYFKLKDSSGNFTTGTAKVIVPVQSGGTAIDDGPNFTVTSSCP